jgi:hypothetical protein
MKNMSHLSTGKYLISASELRDFTEDMEDLDETICALCGNPPDDCPCYVHPPHSCKEQECDCSLECSCCEVQICDCENHDGVQ